MKRITTKLLRYLPIFVISMILVSCGDDDDDDNNDDDFTSGDVCPVGRWTLPENCPGEAAFITFNSDGTGVTTQPDCNQVCSEPASVIEFNWSSTGSSITFNYTSSVICGIEQSPPDGGSAPFTCSSDGTELTINGVTWFGEGTSGATSGSGSGSSGSGIPGGSDTGLVSFWTASQTLGGAYIDITMNGDTQRIDQFFTSGSPNCGDDGAVTFSLAPGSYDWTGTGQDGARFEGTAEVTANSCLIIQLVE